MVGTNLMDEIDCGSFFDHIDDLLDFPSDDLDAELAAVNADFNSFPAIFPDCSSDPLLGSDAVFSDNSASDLSAQLSVPYEDIVQLEWLSTFVEDSFSSGGMTMEKSNLSSTKDSFSSTQSQRQSQFQTSSPISVLESCSSSFGGKTIPVTHDKKARSKRPRPPTFNPRPSIDQLISPTTDTLEPIFVPSAESLTTSADSRHFNNTPKEVQGDYPKIKKKKIKIVFPSNRVDTNQNPNPTAPQAVRKCMHCEITKTPQWRAGPMGPKTLCNACGVRYKSGRLFPEYRPAASPTFTPSIHSNSHKKVVEMRTPKEALPGIIPTSMTNDLGIEKETSQKPHLIPTTDRI